jgi:hypothetical protein
LLKFPALPPPAPTVDVSVKEKSPVSLNGAQSEAHVFAYAITFEGKLWPIGGAWGGLAVKWRGAEPTANIEVGQSRRLRFYRGWTMQHLGAKPYTNEK